jgi:hypothetical protein
LYRHCDHGRTRKSRIGITVGICRYWALPHTSAGPRPPLADRLTPAQWLALDVVAAVLVALWVVFDVRLRHGFRFELPQAWFGVLGAAVTLPVAVRRRWPIPVLAVVAAAVATLTALGRAELDVNITLGMAIYTVAVTCRRPVAVAALVGTETVLAGGLIAASAGAHGAPTSRWLRRRASARPRPAPGCPAS